MNKKKCIVCRLKYRLITMLKNDYSNTFIEQLFNVVDFFVSKTNYDK